MRNLKVKLDRQNRKDSKKSSSQKREPQNWKNFRKKKHYKSLKLRKWSKNFLLLKPYKKPKQQQPRRPQLRLILLDWRESMNCQGERLRPNSKCLRLNNKWKLSKLLNLKNKSRPKIKLTPRKNNNKMKLRKLKKKLMRWKC